MVRHMFAVMLAASIFDPTTGIEISDDHEWYNRFPSKEYAGKVTEWQKQRINWMREQQSNESRTRVWLQWKRLIEAQESKRDVWIILYRAHWSAMYRSNGKKLRETIGEKDFAAGQMPFPY